MAFFKLAKKYHPDLNPHLNEAQQDRNKAMFQEINEAYQVLADPDLKTRYD